MGFNKVAVTRRNTAGWSRIFGGHRTMSNWRLLGSAISLFLGISMIYASFFYVPAFVNVKKYLHLNGPFEAPPPASHSEFYRKYSPILSVDRTYLNQGQIIEAFYSLEPGTRGELVFYQCQSPAIIEAFYCDPIIVQSFKLKQTKGSHTVRVNMSDFYGFAVVLPDPETPYATAWRRIY